MHNAAATETQEDSCTFILVNYWSSLAVAEWFDPESQQQQETSSIDKPKPTQTR